MPTPGATSASLSDMEAGSYVDNNDGTYLKRTVTPAQIPANQWNSLGNVSSATAPTANTPIVTVNVPAQQGGYYEITLVYGYGGTAEATTADNFAFVINSNTVTKLPATISVANTLFPAITFRRKLAAGDAINLSTSNSAGSANSVYKASITATRVA